MQPPKTPGVYIREIPRFPPSIASVATAVPAFVGYTERGETVANKAVEIGSLLDYERIFGGPERETGISATITQSGGATEVTARLDGAPSAHILFYSMQAYFANGGGRCYVVSVGGFGTVDLAQLTMGLETLERVDETTLILVPEAQSLTQNDHFGLVDTALDQCAKLQDRFVIADLNRGAPIDSLGDRVTAFRQGVTSSGLKYGAAYAPSLLMAFDYAFDEGTVTLAHTVDGARGPFDGATLATLVGAPDTLYDRITAAVRRIPVELPPSGAMAGVYSRVDASRGVWKAPANVGLNNVIDLTEKITDEDQQGLNVDPSGKSINAIREFTGRGILAWGARTLDGNSDEWRYIPVRRFFSTVEESVKKATARFVFEPNDANTWTRVRAMIENFLLLQWRSGALQGNKSEQAFFVKVGLGESMTALDVLEGRMNVEVGMAVLRPAEFIIFKFSHRMPQD